MKDREGKRRDAVEERVRRRPTMIQQILYLAPNFGLRNERITVEL